MARGNQTADQVAKRAALHNNDLIGVATLVPQTNLPEIPSYTEGESLKAKSKGFQEDHMGWFQKEGLLFLPGNLQWKLVNSLHATTHLGEKALQGLLVSRECMFLSSLSRHNKDLERQTLKPSARHSSWVLDKLWYSS